MHYYLIVSEGGEERVLCEGSREELEELARKLLSAKRFRYVRVDADEPPGERRHEPPAGQPAKDSDAGSASAP